MKCKVIGILALVGALALMPFGVSHAAADSTIDVATITLDQLEELRKEDLRKWQEVCQDLRKNHPEKMKEITQEFSRRHSTDVKAVIHEKEQGKTAPDAPSFKGICGLELGSEMDVSKLKFEEVMNYRGEKVWSKAFHGKVVPPKPIKGLTAYEVFVSAKTHRLFMIKAYTDDWAIFNNPMFMFKYKANWAPTPNEILEDPGIVKATEKKYSMVADRSGDQKFFKRKECGYYQWMLKFGSRIEGFCFDPVKTDWQNDALFGGKCPVVMLAIDTEIEKEAQAEGVSYEKDKEATALKAGAAAADEAADAL